MKIKKFNESNYSNDNVEPSKIVKRYLLYSKNISNNQNLYSFFGECDLETMIHWYNSRKNDNTEDMFYIEEVTKITKKLTDEDFNIIIQQSKYNL